MPQSTFTKKSIDRSGNGQFSFSFFCDLCGKEWASLKKLFSGGGCAAIENDEAIRLLWAHERRLAFEESSLDARSCFNRCPVCGKWVCDACFCLGDEKCGECKWYEK
jgi:hypothetical protein